MTGRTKATVADGVMREASSEDRRLRVIEYEPGNGSRYVVTFVALGFEYDRAMDSIVGCQDGSTMVIINSARRAATFGPSGLLTCLYFQEATDLPNEADAVVLCEMVGWVLKRPTDVARVLERYARRHSTRIDG